MCLITEQRASYGRYCGILMIKFVKMVDDDEKLAKNFEQKNVMFKYAYYGNLEDSAERKNLDKSLSPTLLYSHFKIHKHTLTCIKHS